jgi:hypothetical protein
MVARHDHRRQGWLFEEPRPPPAVSASAERLGLARVALAAELCDTTPHAIRCLIESGRIRTVQIGASLFVELADIAATKPETTMETNGESASQSHDRA